MEGEGQDGAVVDAGSSPAPDANGQPTPPAATQPEQPQQPGQPTPEKLAPFHQHPRFQQVTRENRELKQAVGTLTQRLQTLEQRSQQQPNGLTPEQQTQYRDAAQALRAVMQADPELARLIEAAKQFPQMQQGYQSLGQLQQAQQVAQQQQATTHVRGLAEKAGLPTDQKFVQHLVRMTAIEAKSLDDADGRFDRGDFSVLDEAFAIVKDQVLGGFSRQATQTLRDTKQKTQNLPPAPRGGFATPDAPKKPIPGKEREYEQELHKGAMDFLAARFKG